MMPVLVAFGLAILSIGSYQAFSVFRDGSFRARGDRLIVRAAHPVTWWMNFTGLLLFNCIGLALICWALL
jgi:hypothetical protein